MDDLIIDDCCLIYLIIYKLYYIDFMGRVNIFSFSLVQTDHWNHSDLFVTRKAFLNVKKAFDLLQNWNCLKSFFSVEIINRSSHITLYTQIKEQINQPQNVFLYQVWKALKTWHYIDIVTNWFGATSLTSQVE